MSELTKQRFGLVELMLSASVVVVGLVVAGSMNMPWLLSKVKWAVRTVAEAAGYIP